MAEKRKSYYKPVPEDQKKRAGRPRKWNYLDEKYTTERIEKRKLTKQQVAELSNGVKIVQLDFETGEYIDEYPSISALANDYDIPLSSVTGSFQRSKCCMIRLPKYQLLLMRKHHYESMIKRDNLG